MSHDKCSPSVAFYNLFRFVIPRQTNVFESNGFLAKSQVIWYQAFMIITGFTT
jgi:hypothetical protein